MARADVEHFGLEENGWDYLHVLLRGLDTVSRLDRRNLVRPRHGCIVVDLRLAMGRTPRLLIPHKCGLVAGLIRHVELCQPWKLARCLLSLRLQEYARMRNLSSFRTSMRRDMQKRPITWVAQRMGAALKSHKGAHRATQHVGFVDN